MVNNIDIMIFDDTQYYKQATIKLNNFIIECEIIQINNLIKKSSNSWNLLGFEAAEAAERLRELFAKLSIVMSDDVIPIGCRSFHFPKMVGKVKQCMYCNKKIDEDGK